MTVQVAHACWCGGKLGEEIGRYYRCCNACGAAVLAVLPAPAHFDVLDDERDFYGKRYWTEYSKARDLSDISQRVRSDLSERCLFWLERLLEVAQPPGRALEIGCGHGAFVRLMRDLGFDAMGTELSGWVVEFARGAFDVPVLRGRLETLALEPGFKCIAAFDVLEHVSDPLETVRRCGDLLAPDGVLVLQTPVYRGEGPEWRMFQQDEHIHLFTEKSMRFLLARAGFREVLVRPSLFPYDMWVVATRGRLDVRTTDQIEVVGDWRLPAPFRSLLDLSRQLRRIREDLALADADRVGRLEQINELSRLLRESESDRAERLKHMEELDRLLRDVKVPRGTDANRLTALLRESEADRAARLKQVEERDRRLRELEAARVADANKLTALLRESEADRAARLAQVTELTRLLREADADRVARLAQMEERDRRLRELEAARVADANNLTALLRESEADRAARLAQVTELTRLLQEADADRVARLAQVEERDGRLRDLEATRVADVSKLTALLRESETDRAARLARVEEVTRLLQEEDAARSARLARRVEDLTRLLQESDTDRAARLAQVEELTRLLQERAQLLHDVETARLDDVSKLTALLRESETDRAARFDVIQHLQARISHVEGTWAWRLYSKVSSSLTGRKPAE